MTWIEVRHFIYSFLFYFIKTGLATDKAKIMQLNDSTSSPIVTITNYVRYVLQAQANSGSTL